MSLADRLRGLLGDRETGRSEGDKEAKISGLLPSGWLLPHLSLRALHLFSISLSLRNLCQTNRPSIPVSLRELNCMIFHSKTRRLFSFLFFLNQRAGNTT